MKITKELFDTLKTLTVSMLNDKGHELPNPLPKSIPVGLDAPLTLQQQIQRVLRTELSQEAQNQGLESFEEANDFDVHDPFDIEIEKTVYEQMFDEIPKDIPNPNPPVDEDSAKAEPELTGEPPQADPELTGEPPQADPDPQDG